MGKLIFKAYKKNTKYYLCNLFHIFKNVRERYQIFYKEEKNTTKCQYAREDTEIFLQKKKYKKGDMVTNVIKIFLKMKNKGYLNIEIWRTYGFFPEIFFKENVFRFFK